MAKRNGNGNNKTTAQQANKPPEGPQQKPPEDSPTKALQTQQEPERDPDYQTQDVVPEEIADKKTLIDALRNAVALIETVIAETEKSARQHFLTDKELRELKEEIEACKAAVAASPEEYDEEGTFVTVPEYAKLFILNRSTVIRHIRLGIIPAIKLNTPGKRDDYRIPQSYIEQCKARRVQGSLT